MADLVERLTLVPPPGEGLYLGQYEWEPGDIGTLEQVIGRRVPLWSAFQGAAVSQHPPRLDVEVAQRSWEDGRPLRAWAIEAYPGPMPIAGIPDQHPEGFTIDRLCRGDYDRALAVLA